jgi:ergothioneine biosynthesis protein EgtB
MKANLYLEQSMQEEQMRETSNADWPAWEAGDANTELDSKYKAVRSVTRSLAARLSAEDQIVQSCPEASPVKWHQAHTTWFFETFVLRQFLTDYQPFREEFSWLFNSYYNSLGEEIPEKKLRALFSRPSLDEILAFRLHVDEAIERLLAGEVDEEASRRIILGLHHEQQHQELALTDIKHAFYSSPLHPAYSALRSVVQKDLPSLELKWHSFDGGLVEIGYSLDATNSFDFCFDNETSRHKVYLEPFQIANRLVTCREYLDFIADGAYSRPEFWLSEGWDMVRQQGWQAPLYWEPDPADETGWRAFTLCGWHSLGALVDTPVCHVSFFEADAYARWRGCRLPTESEWGVCGGEGTAAWDFTRNGRAASSSDARRGHSTTLRRLLGMDSKPIHRLSGIQAACRCPGRVQRQVYVESDDSAGRFVRDSCESYSRNLSKFLSTGDALAVHRNPLGIVEANTYGDCYPISDTRT